MVKFGRNKFRALNKLTKTENVRSNNSVNKVIKKKLNLEKKVTFQKEILLKESVKSDELVINVNKTKVTLDSVSKKPPKIDKVKEKVKKPTLKAVEKNKKRQQTQLNDTKLLLKLMKNKQT